MLKVKRSRMPHLRLRDMYIVLFVLLGALLCVAEINRQLAFVHQRERVDTADSIRSQSDRVAAIKEDLLWALYSADAEEVSRRLEILPARIDLLLAGQRQLADFVSSCRSIPKQSCDRIEEAGVSAERIAELAASGDIGRGAAATRDALVDYSRSLQQASNITVGSAQEGIRSVSSVSLMLFLITAGVLLFEALFLILPTTHSLRDQWERMAESGRRAVLLSDKFRELIDSSARIHGVGDDGKGSRITIRPAETAPEAVFDFAQLRRVQASLHLFEAGVANSRDGVVIVEGGPSPRIIYANEAMSRVTGFGSGTLLSMNPLDLHDSDRDRRRLEESLAATSPVSLQTRQTRPGGSVYSTDVDVIPVSTSTGPPTHRVLVYRDITARLHAQAALEESVERLELLSRITLDGIYDLNLLTGHCWRNNQLVRGFGRPETSDRFFEWLRGRLHPEDADSVIESLFAFTRSDRSSWGAEYRQLRTDGTWARVLDRALLLRDPTGAPVRLIGSLQDITEQREQEWQLRQSESRLRAIIDDQTELVCRYNADGTLVFVNETYARYFDTTPHALVGTSFLDLIPEEDRGIARAVIESLNADHPVTTTENRVRRGDGTIRWLRWTDRVILDAEGQAQAYQTVGRDVTEEIVAKRELEQAESRYRAFIRNSYEAIFRLEIDPPIDTSLPPKEQARLLYERGVFAEVNDAFSRQYGRTTAAESVGLRVRDVFGEDPDSVRQNLEQFEHFIGQGYQVDQLDSYEIRADGTPAIFSNSTVGIVEDGRLVRVWGTQRDITDSRLAQEQLRHTNTMLELFIEHAPASVAMFDREMRYIATSRRWMRDYRLSDEDIVGRSHYEVFHHIPDEWRAIHAHCLEGGTATREEDTLVANDGAPVWIRWEIRPWFMPEGEVGGIVMFTEDITGQKQDARRLREINDQQQRLLTELDHRVKNALGGLLALIEMGTLRETDVPTYAASIARRVRSMAAAHAMLSESRWQPLRLGEIIKNITPADTAGEIVPSGPELLVPAHQATPLAMVLQEFVSNSLKYGALSSDGGVAEVTWKVIGVSEEGAREVAVVWQERGGPPVEPPAQEGLGTQLIRGFARFELRGSVELDFSNPEGVRHRLICRLGEQDGSR